MQGQFFLVKNYLDALINKEKIPHALLFAGPKQSQKKEEAYHFAHTLLKSKKNRKYFKKTTTKQVKLLLYPN